MPTCKMYTLTVLPGLYEESRHQPNFYMVINSILAVKYMKTNKLKQIGYIVTESKLKQSLVLR